jgi:hypothetical protein
MVGIARFQLVSQPARKQALLTVQQDRFARDILTAEPQGLRETAFLRQTLRCFPPPSYSGQPVSKSPMASKAKPLFLCASAYSDLIVSALL